MTVVAGVLCAAAATATATTACSSTEDAPVAAPADAAIEAGPFATADHPVLPQVVGGKGPMLRSPKVVPIFFPGFGYRTEVVGLAETLGASSYWSATTSEYGVGPLTSAPAVDVKETPARAVRNSEIRAWLVSRFDGTHPEFGTQPLPEAIYSLYYPATTTVELDAIGDGPDAGAAGATNPRTCVDVAGYHDDVLIGGQAVAYAVMVACDGDGLSGTTDELVTGLSSHEWVEASTDPLVRTNPATLGIDGDHSIWAVALGGGELADLCENAGQLVTSTFVPGVEYSVQRSWSNAAARASQDPCVPARADAAYFNTVAVLPDTVILQGFPTMGITVHPGETKSIDLVLFSTAPTDPWTVTVTPFEIGPAGGFLAMSDVDVDVAVGPSSTGVNGDKLTLTIHKSPSAVPRIRGFLVTSTLALASQRWFGAIGD